LFRVASYSVFRQDEQDFQDLFLSFLMKLRKNQPLPAEKEKQQIMGIL